MTAGDLLARMMGKAAGGEPPAGKRRPAPPPEPDDADEAPLEGDPDDEGELEADAGDEAAARALDALEAGDASGFKRAVCEMLEAEGY